jgi:hypothetical protein
MAAREAFARQVMTDLLWEPVVEEEEEEEEEELDGLSARPPVAGAAHEHLFDARLAEDPNTPDLDDGNWLFRIARASGPERWDYERHPPRNDRSYGRGATLFLTCDRLERAAAI